MSSRKDNLPRIRQPLPKKGQDRRRLLTYLGIGTGIVGFGVPAIALLRNNKPETEEQQIDRVMTEVDASVEQLSTQLSGKMQPDNILLRPLQLYEYNRVNNPNRNGELLRRIVQTEDYKNPDIDFFYFDIDRRSGIIAGAYSPAQRMFSVNPNFTSAKLIHGLITYHEMVHMMQDTDIRKTFQSKQQEQEYVDFFGKVKDGEKPHIVGLAEQQAYAAEIEVLNALVNGQLQSDLEKDQPESLTDQYMSHLGALPLERDLVDFLLQTAQVYYSSGSRFDDIKPEFGNLIDGLYRANGYDVYGFDASGNLELLR